MSFFDSSHSFLKQRLLHESESSSFDPRVFWSVNAMLITLLLIVLVWCFRGGAEKISVYLTREAAGSSDAAYLQRVRERREREAQEKMETPQERLETLKESFQRNKVHMIVKANDFVEESVIEIVENEQQKELSLAVPEEKMGLSRSAQQSETPAVDVENGARIDEKDGKAVIVDETVEGEPSSENDEHDFAPRASIELGSPADEVESAETNTSSVEQHEACMGVELGSPDMEENNAVITEQDHMFAMNEVETGAPGYIKLRLASGKKRTVPNCCAVCLCFYEEGETVVWSSNRLCNHAFHEECVMEWLIKMQDGTPCPCCRQEFTDVNKRKQRQKSLQSGPSFDVSVIHL